MLKRRASAVWEGSLKEGKGTLSATGGVLNNTPFSFKTRFQSEDGQAGTNPEELLAAAHAGCFAMAISGTLTRQNITPERLEVSYVQTMNTETLTITDVELTIKGTVPGISAEEFQAVAEDAKQNCIISRALSPDINVTLNASLV